MTLAESPYVRHSGPLWYPFPDTAWQRPIDYSRVSTLMKKEVEQRRVSVKYGH